MKARARTFTVAAGAVLIFLLLAFLSVGASAEPVSGTCGETAFWTLGDDGVMTISGEGPMDDYDSLSEVPWTDLHASVKRVIFTGNVTNVGRHSFDYCEKLKYVTLGPKVERIGDNAFSRCYALEDIAINGNVIEIGREAFCDDYSLWCLYLGRGIERIGESAFESCRSLESVNIPRGVTEIGPQAFFGCTGMVSLTVPKDVTSIGQAAFGYCTSLEEISLPSSVGSVPDYAFFNCTSLRRVMLGEGITSVGEEAFLGCGSLEFVYLPGTLESIPPYSLGYYYRDGYHSFGIFDTAAAPGTPGGDYVEENGLLLITIDPDHECGSVCEFCGKCLDPECRYYNCYEKCPGHTFPVGGKEGNVTWFFDGEETLTLTGEGEMTPFRAGSAPWYPYRRLITRVTVGEGFTSVGNYAFWELYNAREIILPERITFFGTKSFFGCSSLEILEIPDGVVRIGDYAFSCCESVTAVELPDSVEEVGRFAFYRTPLENVSLGRVVSVGDCAFDTRGTLREIACPPSLVRIGGRAFGYRYTGGRFDRTPGFLISGEAGSAAEEYAAENGFPFVTGEWVLPFADVGEKVWYRNSVEFTAKRGLFGGVTATEFAPSRPMTRAMFVTVVWRLDGKPMPENGNPFIDVKRGSYYEKAAAWASECGIVGGIGGGRFDPDGSVTREQIAAILMRYAAYRGENVSGRAPIDPFPDGSRVSRFARNAVEWALDNGILRGIKTEDGVYLMPRESATRAEVATMIMRFSEQTGRTYSD